MPSGRTTFSPLPDVTRFFGYAGSLRPYSLSALSNRAMRRGVKLLRGLPGGRQVFRPRHETPPFSGSAEACPTVDAGPVLARLESLGVAIDTFDVDPDAFGRFLRDARFPSWYYPHNGVPSVGFLEKTLEHYVGSRLLDVGSDDVYLDIGADNSPFSTIAESLFACRAYQLDAAYRKGVRGRYVGSDVRRIPLPDGSMTKLASHCAFDHFQGDADRAFMAEAARLLRPGGRLCILPLYLSDQLTNFVDPSACLKPPTVDDGARLIDVTGWGYEFSRYYSPEAFVKLASLQSSDLSLRVYRVTGTEAIHPGCYLRLAAVFDRK